jgi:hypothetical protein
MRSFVTGIFLSTITMVFATWFLSSAILKTIQKSKTSSCANSESVAEKIQPHNKASYGSNTSSIYEKSSGRSSSRRGKTRFQKISNPFGTKLSIRNRANSFAPKLSLRRSHSWRHRRKRETYPQEKQYQQTKTSSKSTSSSPIISEYQNYIDMLNNQMKD